MPATDASGQDQGKEITRGVVAIYKDYLGRGPTTARTVIAGDHVSTICEDGLTQAERRLVEGGEADCVRSIRRTFQVAMRDDILALVAGVTGRTPRTLLSDHDPVADIMVETVILEPEERSA